MNFNEYQEKALSTAIYGEENAFIYPALGLCGEAGEVAEKVKKVIRDDGGKLTNEKSLEIAKELGDVLWYVAALAHDLTLDMGFIAEQNIAKLESRKKRDIIHGDGDNR